MKILVFGAGEHGARASKKNGLRIKDKFSPRMSVSRIPVTAELKAEDKYDMIFVVLRY